MISVGSTSITSGTIPSESILNCGILFRSERIGNTVILELKFERKSLNTPDHRGMQVIKDHQRLGQSLGWIHLFSLNVSIINWKNLVVEFGKQLGNQNCKIAFLLQERVILRRVHYTAGENWYRLGANLSWLLMCQCWTMLSKSTLYFEVFLVL